MCVQIHPSTADQFEGCTVSGHISPGEVGVLIIRQNRWMPCIPSQFTETHGNPLTNKEHHSAHIPCHYVKQKPPHYIITTHAVLAHAHRGTLLHNHASTSLQCSSPELSPNICGAGHVQLEQQYLVKVQHWMSINKHDFIHTPNVFWELIWWLVISQSIRWFQNDNNYFDYWLLI